VPYEQAHFDRVFLALRDLVKQFAIGLAAWPRSFIATSHQFHSRIEPPTDDVGSRLCCFQIFRDPRESVLGIDDEAEGIAPRDRNLVPAFEEPLKRTLCHTSLFIDCNFRRLVSFEWKICHVYVLENECGE